ncbi:MAG: leucine--tRNA ligase, partial [Candidatus Bathyarchaeia archaeon]
MRKRVNVDWGSLEAKWLKRWGESRIFEANPNPGKKKFFLTVAYPYPNSPQHIGHGRTYTLADAYARYLRMRGYNVLFPMGFHYTGTPVLAMAKRLKMGDKELAETFTKIYKVPEETLAEFNEPMRIAQYFHREIKDGMRSMGYSIDWRREFTTIDPPYSKFIEWQFEVLRERGLIKKGSHPVGWCPACGNPVGQHDTVGDVEPEIEEFTLIKFQLPKSIAPTATLRPETVYGVTNIWVNPESEYVEAEVDGESWVVSREASEKLKLLNRVVKVKRSFKGHELLGQLAVNPANGSKIPILPAGFVDPDNATGVVMSVPAHAPFDFQALLDLKRSMETLNRYGINPSLVEELKPIPIIRVEGYASVPAEEAVLRRKIIDQNDPRLEEATEEVYSREFHKGVMAPGTEPYAGLPVQEAKRRLIEDFLQSGKADKMYEIINKPVTCRCGARCVVKVFEDQWFIDYGDQEWKSKALKCLSHMRILPDEIKTEFEYTVWWLKEKACARREGLGTKLPWDKRWVIESLSD